MTSSSFPISRLATLAATAVLALALPVVAAEKKKKAKAAKSPTTTAAQTSMVTVVDGVVQPRRPLPDAIADAIQFLRKADGAYVPGNLKGELAGYFMAAHVNADG